MDASGDPAGLRLALSAIEPGATCVSTAIYPQAMFKMYDVGVTLVTRRINARATIPAVLGLVAAEGFDPGPVTDPVVAWEEVPAALDAPGLKTVVTR